MTNHSTHFRFLRTTALFVTICFLSSTISWSAPSISSNVVGAIHELPLQSLANSIDIPAVFGTISERFAGNGPLIIHIQDAHGNYEAQRNTQKILEHLKNQYGLDLIFLEGGVGKADPSLLRFFDEPELSRKTADLLAHNAVLGGTELFLLEELLGVGAIHELPLQNQAGLTNSIEVYGVEDALLYRKNLQAFRFVFRQKTASNEFLSHLKNTILNQASKIFNPRLKTFFKEWLFYQDVPSELTRHLNSLRQFAFDELQIDLRDPRLQLDWPQLLRFFKLQELQDEIKLEAALQEREKLVQWMHKKGISGNFIDGIQQLDLTSKKAGQDSPRFFLEKFFAAAFPKGFTFDQYPQFKNFCGMVILQSELDALQLLSESNRLTQSLLDRLTEKPEEKKLVSLFQDYLLLQKLLSLELMPQDYEKVRERQKELIPEKMRMRLLSAGAPLMAPVNGRDESRPYIAALAFYSLAKKREAVIFEKMIQILRQTKKSKAVLITGGFHSQGLTDQFRQNGISYLEITPRISEIGDNKNYLNVMMLKDTFPSLRSSIVNYHMPLYTRSEVRAVLGQADTDYYERELRAAMREASRSEVRREGNYLEGKRKGAADISGGVWNTGPKSNRLKRIKRLLEVYQSEQIHRWVSQRRIASSEFSPFDSLEGQMSQARSNIPNKIIPRVIFVLKELFQMTSLTIAALVAKLNTAIKPLAIKSRLFLETSLIIIGEYITKLMRNSQLLFLYKLYPFQPGFSRSEARTFLDSADADYYERARLAAMQLASGKYFPRSELRKLKNGALKDDELEVVWTLRLTHDQEIYPLFHKILLRSGNGHYVLLDFRNSYSQLTGEEMNLGYHIYAGNEEDVRSRKTESLAGTVFLKFNEKKPAEEPLKIDLKPETQTTYPWLLASLTNWFHSATNNGTLPFLVDQVPHFPKANIVPTVTPFKRLPGEKLQVDEAAADKYMKYLHEKKRVEAVLIFGKTGSSDAPEVDEELRRSAITILTKSASKAGLQTFTNVTTGRHPDYENDYETNKEQAIQNTIENARLAKEAGANVLVLAPLYLLKDSSEIQAFVNRLYAETDLPIFLYNNPAIHLRKNSPMDPRVIKTLWESGEIAGLKDSSSQWGLTAEYSKTGVRLYAGNEANIATALEFGEKSKKYPGTSQVVGAVGSTGNIFSLVQDLAKEEDPEKRNEYQKSLDDTHSILTADGKKITAALVYVLSVMGLMQDILAEGVPALTLDEKAAINGVLPEILEIERKIRVDQMVDEFMGNPPGFVEMLKIAPPPFLAFAIPWLEVFLLKKGVKQFLIEHDVYNSVRQGIDEIYENYKWPKEAYPSNPEALLSSEHEILYLVSRKFMDGLSEKLAKEQSQLTLSLKKFVGKDWKQSLQKVMDAMRRIPRHLYAPRYFGDLDFEDHIYTDQGRGIGYGQTVSKPSLMAAMLTSLNLQGNEKVLEIGAGTGWFASILRKLTREVYATEIIDNLRLRALEIQKNMGLEDGLHFIKADQNTLGYPEKGPYDVIVVSAAHEEKDPPREIVDQLAENGKLVIPLFDREASEEHGKKLYVLKLFLKEKGELKDLGTIQLTQFVPLIVPSSKRSELRELAPTQLIREILVIDDHQNLLDSILFALQAKFSEGVVVKGFLDSAAAMEYYRKNHEKIGLVLTDWEMPDVNGGNVVYEIRKNSNIPVIIATGTNLTAVPFSNVEILKKGSDKFGKLVSKVGTLVEQSQALRSELRTRAVTTETAATPSPNNPNKSKDPLAILRDATQGWKPYHSAADSLLGKIFRNGSESGQAFNDLLKASTETLHPDASAAVFSALREIAAKGTDDQSMLAFQALADVVKRPAAGTPVYDQASASLGYLFFLNWMQRQEYSSAIGKENLEQRIRMAYGHLAKLLATGNFSSGASLSLLNQFYRLWIHQKKNEEVFEVLFEAVYGFLSPPSPLDLKETVTQFLGDKNDFLREIYHLAEADLEKPAESSTEEAAAYQKAKLIQEKAQLIQREFKKRFFSSGRSEVRNVSLELSGKFRLGDSVEITFIGLDQNGVTLGFRAPDEILIKPITRKSKDGMRISPHLKKGDHINIGQRSHVILVSRPGPKIELGTYFFEEDVIRFPAVQKKLFEDAPKHGLNGLNQNWFEQQMDQLKRFLEGPQIPEAIQLLKTLIPFAERVFSNPTPDQQAILAGLREVWNILHARSELREGVKWIQPKYNSRKEEVWKDLGVYLNNNAGLSNLKTRLQKLHETEPPPLEDRPYYSGGLLAENEGQALEDDGRALYLINLETLPFDQDKWNQKVDQFLVEIQKRYDGKQVAYFRPYRIWYVRAGDEENEVKWGVLIIPEWKEPRADVPGDIRPAPLPNPSRIDEGGAVEEIFSGSNFPGADSYPFRSEVRLGIPALDLSKTFSELYEIIRKEIDYQNSGFSLIASESHPRAWTLIPQLFPIHKRAGEKIRRLAEKRMLQVFAPAYVSSLKKNWPLFVGAYFLILAGLLKIKSRFGILPALVAALIAAGPFAFFLLHSWTRIQDAYEAFAVHAGSQANQAAFLAVLKPKAKVMGMMLSHGGHLTHGLPQNISGRFFVIVPEKKEGDKVISRGYGVDIETGKLDYDEFERQALEFLPDLIIVGDSAYPGTWDFKRMLAIKKKVEKARKKKGMKDWQVILHADISHRSTQISVGDQTSPFGYADTVMTTDQKAGGTRAARLYASKKIFETINERMQAEKNATLADLVRKAVSPGIQEESLWNIVAAQAAFAHYQTTKEYKDYARRIRPLVKAMEDAAQTLGMKLVMDGSETHLLLFDIYDTYQDRVSGRRLFGSDAQKLLESVGIGANGNTIPVDDKNLPKDQQQTPRKGKGIRLGAPTLAARNVSLEDARRLIWLTDKTLIEAKWQDGEWKLDPQTADKIRVEVEALAKKYPIPDAEIYHEILKGNIVPALEEFAKKDPELAKLMLQELEEQSQRLTVSPTAGEVIPEVSTPAVSPQVNRYAEGPPGDRYYSLNKYNDEAEWLAQAEWKKLIGNPQGIEVNVEAHTHAQAIEAVLMALAKPADSLFLTLRYPTHGHPDNFTRKLFENNLKQIKSDSAEELRAVLANHPEIILYDPTEINSGRLREIVGKETVLIADAGTIALRLADETVDVKKDFGIGVADVVIFDTKQAGGFPGGVIYIKEKEIPTASGKKEKISEKLQRAILPGIQGGPLLHMISMKGAVARWLQTGEAKKLAFQLKKNFQIMQREFERKGFTVYPSSQGTWMSLDLKKFGLTRASAEELLASFGMDLSDDAFIRHPDDAQYDQVIDIGLAALTLRGFDEEDIQDLVRTIILILQPKPNESWDQANGWRQAQRAQVARLVERHPVHGELKAGLQAAIVRAEKEKNPKAVVLPFETAQKRSEVRLKKFNFEGPENRNITNALAKIREADLPKLIQQAHQFALKGKAEGASDREGSKNIPKDVILKIQKAAPGQRSELRKYPQDLKPVVAVARASRQITGPEFYRSRLDFEAFMRLVDPKAYANPAARDVPYFSLLADLATARTAPSKIVLDYRSPQAVSKDELDVVAQLAAHNLHTSFVIRIAGAPLEWIRNFEKTLVEKIKAIRKNEKILVRQGMGIDLKVLRAGSHFVSAASSSQVPTFVYSDDPDSLEQIRKNSKAESLLLVHNNLSAEELKQKESKAVALLAGFREFYSSQLPGLRTTNSSELLSRNLALRSEVLRLLEQAA